MKMTGEQMDQYMDYYERTFIDKERVESENRGLPNELLDMFPTGRANGSSPAPYSYKEQTDKEQAATEQKLKTVVGAMKLRPIAAENNKEPVRRIGDFYKRYRRVEDLEGVAKVFYERVAEAVGVRVETLVLAVGQVERRLIVWREGRLREGRLREGVEDVEDEENEAGRPDREDRRGKAVESGEDVEMGDESEGYDDDTADSD